LVLVNSGSESLWGVDIPCPSLKLVAGSSAGVRVLGEAVLPHREAVRSKLDLTGTLPEFSGIL